MDLLDGGEAVAQRRRLLGPTFDVVAGRDHVLDPCRREVTDLGILEIEAGHQQRLTLQAMAEVVDRIDPVPALLECQQLADDVGPRVATQQLGGSSHDLLMAEAEHRASGIMLEELGGRLQLGLARGQVLPGPVQLGLEVGVHRADRDRHDERRVRRQTDAVEDGLGGRDRLLQASLGVAATEQRATDLRLSLDDLVVGGFEGLPVARVDLPRGVLGLQPGDFDTQAVAAASHLKNTFKIYLR